MPTSIPVQQQVTVGQRTPLGAVTVPATVDEALLTIDAAFLTDPTSSIQWGFEYSENGGQTWAHFASGSRPGGPAGTDGGGTTTDLVIQITTHSGGWDIRGDQLRGFLTITKGVQAMPNHIAVTGTLLLSP
jgi:hypothetical protein